MTWKTSTDATQWAVWLRNDELSYPKDLALAGYVIDAFGRPCKDYERYGARAYAEHEPAKWFASKANAVRYLRNRRIRELHDADVAAKAIAEPEQDALDYDDQAEQAGQAGRLAGWQAGRLGRLFRLGKDGQPSEAACDCGEIVTRSGNIWVHGNGLVLCSALIDEVITNRGHQHS